VNIEALYRQNYKAIYSFCYRMLGNTENAQDITQETFIKLHHRSTQQNPEIENVKAWLYKVAGNLCLNTLNTKNRHQEIKNSFSNDSLEQISPEKIMIQNEKLQMVKNAIQKLEPEKQALILMYQDGLSYKEMSEATGIKLNSVGKTLWRIIDKISTTIHYDINK
jgi:RNA polymerase sigma-70 factor (ECF subfamily)